MHIYVDITYSFIRQPIKLALQTQLQDSISFVDAEEDADLVIGPSDKIYSKPCVILSDDPHNLVANDTCLAISPTPTSKDEMLTLVLKIADLVGKL